ncbi:MAG: aldehyde ferredoxin oxidoreductase N-terminal domain-containing protein [Pseudomonadota bacterium]
MNGYTGKILRINLSSRSTTTIDTQDYAQWGGGHGIGSALFFDLVKDKSINGLDPANVVTIMTSPLTGTMALGASARTELQGIGLQSYPVGWFTRSGFGGRFGPMLKYAGWDGLVLEGKADKPVWVDIRDDAVAVRDCTGLSLWGKDTRETQQAIWDYVVGSGTYGNWFAPGSAADVRTTQRPAVLAIGPAGENLCRVASIVHDAGNSAGQGGFGAVWGSKNLKAVSVIGTGDISVADPKALLETRQWALDNYTFPLNSIDSNKFTWATMPSNLRSFPVPLISWQTPQCRPQSCLGCQAGCRCRYDSGTGNESECKEFLFYRFMNLRYFSAQIAGGVLRSRSAEGKNTALLEKLYSSMIPHAQIEAADIAQKYGINVAEPETGIPYLKNLQKMGVRIRGKALDEYLPFNKLGDIEFAEKLLHMIAYREEIGNDMAEGFTRAAESWGRIEDMQNGTLNNCYWGLPMHYDPRVSLEWGYGTIFADRDINEHGLNPLYMIPMISKYSGTDPPLPAEEYAKLFYEKMVPFADDPMIVDYSNGNMYSEHLAKLVAWHRHYGRFWIQSALFCDLQYPDFFNWAAKGYKGITGDGEPKFFNAVTGSDLTFADGIALGRKIWNLDNAIWSLQGRTRDMVTFSDYIYDTPSPKYGTFTSPVQENGQWIYADIGERSIDRSAFEDFKTKYYTLEGWDTQTGWPTRSTLEALALGFVADELEKNGKLGKEAK